MTSLLRTLLQGSAKRGLTFQQVFNTGSDILLDSGKATPEQARRSLAVYACWSLISGDMANLPFKAFRKVGDSRLPLEPQPSWLDMPNPDNLNYSAISYKRQVVLSQLSDGNAFVYVTPDVFNPTKLQVLNPTQVTITDGDRSPLYEVRDPRGVTLGVLTPLNVLHMPFVLPPGETRGLSPVQAAAQAINIDLAASKQGNKFLSGGSLVTGIIEVPREVGDLTEQQVDDLRESFKRKREGPNGYSIGVLQGGATFKPITMSQQDAQYIETRKFGLEDIARLYLIPPFMVGSQEPAGVAYASSVEREQHYIDHCLFHYGGPLETGHKRLLTDEQYMKVVYDAFLKGDLKSRYESYAVGLNTKFLYLEDVWGKEELNPDRGGTLLETPNNNGPQRQEAPAEVRETPQINITTPVTIADGAIRTDVHPPDISMAPNIFTDHSTIEQQPMITVQSPDVSLNTDATPFVDAILALKAEFQVGFEALRAEAAKPVTRTVERDKDGRPIRVVESR